jgi:predicted AAA+ superfamily ATPase
MSRYLTPILDNHLKTLRQMAFLTGPRQVGKTTLAKSFLHPIEPGTNYFNWDIAAERKKLMSQVFTGKEALGGDGVIVFDEIHKYLRWKNTLKGLFDQFEPHTHWIITGSARLDIHRRGQDSLLGRHFTYHLAPYSVAELTQHISVTPLRELVDTVTQVNEAPELHEALSTLDIYGGFPEPLFTAQENFLHQWRDSRLDRLVNQDLGSLEALRNLPLVEQLMMLLPSRVGSPLSINSLREELEVHFATVKHWMELLENVYYGFYVRPFSKKFGRMLKKEPKWYLWDWTEMTDPAARFENLVAVHLRKYTDFMRDTGKAKLSLHFVRDKQKRETDFLICDNLKPALLIECKLSSDVLDDSLHYYADALNVKNAVQLVAKKIPTRQVTRSPCPIWVMPAARFLAGLV